MQIKFVSLIVGGLLLIEVLAMLVCLGLSFVADGLYPGMTGAWGVSLLYTLVCALGLIFWGRKSMDAPIFRREAFAVVGLGWLAAGFFGALPFILPPFNLAVWDSLFECYSGFTTTGATIFSDLSRLPPSLLLWRSLTQWMGGMGIVVLFVALLGFLGVGGGRSLFHSETSALAESDLKPRIRSLGRSYLKIYLAWTAIGIVGLLIGGMSLFDAVCHSMCAIATGGFSPYSESIAHFPQWYIQLWLIGLMVVGGIALPVHYQVFVLKKRDVLKWNDELKLYLVIILAAFIVVTIDLLNQSAVAAVPAAMLQSLFQVVSIMTTTGFVTADFGAWPDAPRIILLLLMIVGGCAGSTSGGMKVARIIVFWKAAQRELRRIFRPHLILRLRMNGRMLDEDIVTRTIFYIALYFVLLIIGVLGLSLLEPQMNLESVFSAVLASFNNIGPGLGDVGPSQNYAFFNPISKAWLSLYMILGRLELFALLLLFLPSFWKKF